MLREVLLADDTYDNLAVALADALSWRDGLEPEDVRRTIVVPHLLIAQLLDAGVDLGEISHAGDIPVPAQHCGLLVALVELEACPWSGKVEPYQLGNVLGEANVWPALVELDQVPFGLAA